MTTIAASRTVAFPALESSRAETVTPEQLKQMKARMAENRAKREADPEFMRQRQINEKATGGRPQRPVWANSAIAETRQSFLKRLAPGGLDWVERQGGAEAAQRGREMLLGHLARFEETFDLPRSTNIPGYPGKARLDVSA